MPDIEANKQDIVSRLDIIIRILLTDKEALPRSSRERITWLNEMGLRNTEIAKLLNTTANHVAVEISKAKKGAR
jgi:hypothetical protein